MKFLLAAITLALLVPSPASAQDGLEGIWRGPFRDRVDGLLDPDGQVSPIICEGTMRLRLQQSDGDLVGWLDFNPQRCRWQGRPWFDSPLEDVRVERVVIDGNEVWLETSYATPSGGEIQCDFQARYGRDTLRGTYACSESFQSWTGEGEFTLSRISDT